MNEGRIREKKKTGEENLLADSGFDAVRRDTDRSRAPEEKRQELQTEQKLRGNDYLRSVEDSVEQNDNSFDGIINNLPEEAEGSVSGIAEKKKDDEKESLREEIRRQAEHVIQPVHEPQVRVPCLDGEERMK